MPLEDTGAFWNATIYSPRNSSKGAELSLPVKQGLEPKQYGGFSGQQLAYFFIYEAKKKGKACFQFAEVPVWLAPRIEVCSEALADYARTLAEMSGLEFVRIARSKIMKKQLIELNGERFVLRGRKELLSGRELAFSLRQLAVLCNENEEGIDELLRYISASADVVGSRISSLIDLPTIADRASGLSGEEKRELITKLCPVLNGSYDRVDLSPIGGAKRTGTLQVKFTGLLNNAKVDFYIIDQSVTGMFERRTRVGL